MPSHDLPQDLAFVVDHALHDASTRFTLYQIVGYLEDWGEPGMARALRATCHAMESALSREYPLPEQLSHD